MLPENEGVRGPAERPSRLAPAALFALLALALPAAGGLLYATSAADLRRQRQRELASIAALKVDEIERWRDERLADAEVIASDPSLAAAAGARGTPAAARAGIAAWFEALRALGEYSAVALVGSDGTVRFSAGDALVDATEPEVLALVRRASQERRPLVTDVHQHGRSDPPHLTAVAPAAGDGVVLVRIDPARWLYRATQSWPTPSPTAEALLVRSGGDRVTVVTQPRHAPAGAPLSIPLARSEDPLVRGALGERGVIEGIDYRGHRVLAAIEQVPQTPWLLVAKMDVAEALEPLRALAAWIVGLVLALVTAAGAATTLWARAQTAAFERARIQADAERRSLARKLERLTRHAREIVILSDEDSRILEVNDRACELLGYSRHELLGMTVRALRDPETVGDFDARVRQQMDEGVASFETRFRRKDGTTFPVEVHVDAEYYEGRRYLQGIIRDVSERKRAEEALRASEAKFRAAFEFASLGIGLVDGEGRIVETNRALRRILGRGEAEPRAATFVDVHAPVERGSAAAILRQLREGTALSVELPRRLLRDDGALADVVLRASALRDEAGAFRYALCVVEDVTEKKRLEAQLMLADRMASVGTLAAGVAHEINNPLAFILANVDFAREELRRAGADPEVLRALDEARDGGLRVREIVRDLKAFSRADEEGRETVDVRRALQFAVGLAQNEIRHRAQLELDLGPIPHVVASEHRLGQVLLNLLVNAAQAIPEGRASENVVRVTTGTAPDGRASVEVSDTGSGIPADVLPRIFDPFFTTKPVGVGTGLGLSICHGIVTAMGGAILVDSQPGRGSTFRVLLPPAPTRAAPAPVPAQAPPPALPMPAPAHAPPSALPAPRRGRILVVDDEALVGRAVVRVLGDAHDVVVCASAREALAAVSGAEPAFDLVLCDLMMPDVSGFELHDRLRELDPALAGRTIFLTGGAFTPAAREFLERVPNARLEKPFEPDALRALVAAALASSARAA